MFEFGEIRFRPVEKTDLQVLHRWENDADLITYSRSNPVNFVNLTQLEKQFDDWAKDEKELHFIVEIIDSKQPIGIARIRRGDWGNVRSVDIGTYIGEKKHQGKGLGRQITVALLEMAFNQMNMERCDAWSVEYNRRAHKALEVCGFKRGGIVRGAAFVNGRRWGGYFFDILRDEYLKIRTKLLKQTLGNQVDRYLKQHCSVK
jgi:RimJ/RimL family protein N-acetyltransferase